MIDLYNMVKEFHIAFGHKAPDEPVALTLAERRVRFGFMVEEIAEFYEANTAVEQVDALVDLSYFAIGTVVNIGSNSAAVRNIQYTRVSEFTTIWHHSSRHELATNLLGRVSEFLLRDSWRAQGACVVVMTNFVSVQMGSRGYDMVPLFQIVHEANMAKLWPDGKPRWRESDGKVLKPVGWVGPEDRLAEEIARQQKGASV